jgi:hypothetical protein
VRRKSVDLNAVAYTARAETRESRSVYWQSCGGGAGVQKQAMFLNVGKPKSMGHFRGEFCEVASFYRLHFVVKLVRAVKAYFVLDAENSVLDVSSAATVCERSMCAPEHSLPTANSR